MLKLTCQNGGNSIYGVLDTVRFYARSAPGVTEQELIFVLYLSENGTPEVKFFSIESVKTADAEGLKSSLEEAFEHTGILSFET